MARKNTFHNGTPSEAEICEECNAPVHPSLECERCNGEDSE